MTMAGVGAAQAMPPVPTGLMPGLYNVGGAPAALVTVPGNGEVEAVPDTAQLTLGVNVVAPTAQAAQNEATATLTRVASVVQSLGVPAESLRTSTLSLSPEFERPGPEATSVNPNPIGFRAIGTVQITTQNFAQLGQLVDQAVRAGANEVQGVTFLLREPQIAQDQALQRALVDAALKGLRITRALGAEPIAIRSVQASTGFIPVPQTISFARAQAAVPVFPGTQPVRADVTVEFFVR